MLETHQKHLKFFNEKGLIGTDIPYFYMYIITIYYKHLFRLHSPRDFIPPVSCTCCLGSSRRYGMVFYLDYAGGIDVFG